MKKYLITLTVIILTSFVFAQKNNKLIFPVESIILNTDRDLYISGEEIRFSTFYLINNLLQNNTFSKIAYLELFDKSGKSIIRQKLKITNNSVSSLMKILENIETGEYNLTAYTQYMKNYLSSGTNTISLIIINPKKRGTHDLVKTKYIDKKNLLPENKIYRINLKTDKKKYTTRKKVQLYISDTNLPDDLKYITISVVKKGSLNDYLPKICKNSKQITINNLQYYPEIRDITISGSLINKETSETIPNQKLYLSLLNKNRQLCVNQTDSKGNFIFTLHSVYNKNNFIIRTEKEIPNSEILINNSFANGLKTFKPVNWFIDSSKINIINEMYYNSQITENFKNLTKDTVLNTDKSIDFFGKEEITVNTADFINLPTLEEIFDEIVPLVYVGKKDKHAFFNIYDEENKTTYRDPLVLYDNVPIFNIDKLLKINPKYIQQIKVINKRYIIGNYIFNGIIFIHSKTGKFGGIDITDNIKLIKYQTCSEKIKTIYPDYSTTNYQKNIPDFRTSLYWNPDIKFTENKTIEFYTSDYLSDYDVIIRGVSSSGKIFFGKTEFKVIQKN